MQAPKKTVRPPRARNGTMGRCANLDYCSVGMQRVLVTVPVGQPFVCPECGGKLRPPAEANAGRPWVMPALRIIVLLAGIGLGGVQGYLIGRAQPVRRGDTAAAPKDAVVQLNTARAMLGLKTLTPEAVVAISTQTASPGPPEPKQASVPVVPIRPYPTRTLPLELADPSQHLQKEERTGQVTLDCILVATRGRPSCRVGDIRGTDAFSAAALAWLRNYTVAYSPDGRDGKQGGADHRWRIIFEDFRGTAPAAKPQAAQR